MTSADSLLHVVASISEYQHGQCGKCGLDAHPDDPQFFADDRVWTTLCMECLADEARECLATHQTPVEKTQ